MEKDDGGIDAVLQKKFRALVTAARAAVPVRIKKGFPFVMAGKEVVDWLVATGESKSREEAVDLGVLLQHHGYLFHVTREQPFRDIDTACY
jgi:hypothetical protein